jgi:hypothetical protein
MNYDDSQGMNITIPVMIVMIIGVRVYMWGFGDGWDGVGFATLPWCVAHDDSPQVTRRSGQSSAKAHEFSIGSTTY